MWRASQVRLTLACQCNSPENVSKCIRTLAAGLHGRALRVRLSVDPDEYDRSIAPATRREWQVRCDGMSRVESELA